MKRAEGVVGALIGGMLLAACGNAEAHPLVSVLYCVVDKGGGNNFFAAAERPDGRLDFSVSVWAPNGHFAGLVGVAQRQGDAWVYRSMDESSKPGRPCIALVRINGSRGGARVTATPLDSCDGGQGAGAHLGDVAFPASSYAGPAPDPHPNVNEDDLGHRCDELVKPKP